MEITPAQKVTLDNFNSHLSNLKTELNTVTEELTIVLKNKEVATSELGVIFDRRKNALNDLELLNTSILNKKITLQELTDELNNVQITHDDRIKSQLLVINDNKIAIDNSKKEWYNISKDCELLENKKLKLSSDIKVLEDKIASTKATMSDIESNKSKLVSNHVLEIAKREIELSMIDTLVKEKQQELAKLSVLVDAERDKIKVPMENLLLREAQLKRKEDNLEILTQRFKKEFKQLHPNLEPRI